MANRFDIKGTNKNFTINMRIPEVKAAIGNVLGDALREGTDAIAERAKELSPVKSGTNRDSIKARSTKKKGRVFTTSGYGGLVEHGTRHSAAHPYMKPAYHERKDVVLKAMENKV